MSGPIERSRTYWPTIILHREGDTVNVSIYAEDGSGSHYTRKADEALEKVKQWLEETGK